VVAALVAFGAALSYPYGQYAHGAAQAWAHVLLVVAAVSLLGLAARRGGSAVATLVVVIAAGALVAGIVASPAPRNDVWFILQGSVHAILHGRNIYTQTWRGVPPRGITNLFPYLPATTLLVSPFFLVFGDVRYAFVTALVLAALAVRRLSPGHVGLVLSGLVLLAPRLLFGVEQSWTEPLLLVLLAAMVWSVERGRPALATLWFATALATKQHLLLIVPLAAWWPAFGWRRTVVAVAAAGALTVGWFIDAPRAFVRGAISYNWHLAPRLDSLSLYTSAIRAGWTPPFVLVPASVALALAAAVWRLPRTTSGFVLGSAWVLGLFDLLNKQTFFNEWTLVVGLVVLALATLGGAPLATDRPRP
jgi:hypothetical protein